LQDVAAAIVIVFMLPGLALLVFLVVQMVRHLPEIDRAQREDPLEDPLRDENKQDD
jgi:hypothetical protein